MNYIRHYNLLIERARGREVHKDHYTEKHHIVPRSEGGTDQQDNIVKLYPREHFIAHWLLYRDDPESISRSFAFNMMSCNRNGTYKPSSRTYAEGVEAAAKANKKNFTGRKAIGRDGKMKYVWPHELDYYTELGWKTNPGRGVRNKGKFWSNNGTSEQFSKELKPGWIKGRLTSFTTKGKKAISKDGIVKYVDNPEEWFDKGWRLGNEKYYPGYLHLERNSKNRPESWTD